MRYRPEIDGLRAVAVLPVILFHGGYRTFSGGFVGVDVFFVISGYLITSILLSDLAGARFSIARFYERRARRILPALFLVIVCCVPFAWLWMTPRELVNFGQSIVSTMVFASNIKFWLEESYFATGAELKPLLHTWSLAVEEQFYVLFPLFLALVWRHARTRMFASVIAVGAASFVLSLILSNSHPSANFYLAPPRAWELMAGAACAFVPAGKPRRWGGPASLLGLGLIAYAVFAYDENTPFPGVYALTPAVGAALVILFAAPGTVVGRVLSSRPAVGLGLISYSAYLWHHPVFAFARLRSAVDLEYEAMAALVALTLLLGWFSWRFVEQPFRRPGAMPLPTRRGVFATSAVVGALLATLGLSMLLARGVPGRFDEDALRYARIAWQHVDTACHFDANRPLRAHPQVQCRHENPAGQVSVMLLGDSHSLAISQAVGKQLRAAGIGYYQVSYGGCVPLPGFKGTRQGAGRACADFDDAALRYAEDAGIDTVVLTGRFPMYLYGERYNNGEGGKEPGASGAIDLLNSPSPDEATREKRVLAAIEQRIREIARRFDVVLVDPIPEAGWNVPRSMFRRVASGEKDVTLGTSYARYLERAGKINALFDRLAEELPAVHAAPVFQALCSEQDGRCVNADPTQAYYKDDNHLSAAGAELVAPIVAQAVIGAPKGQVGEFTAVSLQ